MADSGVIQGLTGIIGACRYPFAFWRQAVGASRFETLRGKQDGTFKVKTPWALLLRGVLWFWSTALVH